MQLEVQGKESLVLTLSPKFTLQVSMFDSVQKITTVFGSNDNMKETISRESCG